MILGNIAYLSWISFVLFLMILKSDHDIDHISTIYQWWIPDTGLDKVVKIASFVSRLMTITPPWDSWRKRLHFYWFTGLMLHAECELEASDKQTFGDITKVNRHKSSFALIK